MKVLVLLCLLFPLATFSLNVGEEKVIDTFLGEKQVYVTCVDSWIGNTRSGCVGCPRVPFNANYQPQSCLQQCQVTKFNY
jgi:hypothetical protein